MKLIPVFAFSPGIVIAVVVVAVIIVLAVVFHNQNKS
jgi:hypothetical protein